MRLLKLNSPIKNILSGFLLTIMMLSFNSCAKKVNFLTSTVVPAAQGTVKIKTDDNNNYAIQISITNLVEVKRLQPAKQVYVVWMVTDQQINKNIGQIDSSTGLLSSKLKASFETVSPIKPIKIFITAEDDASIQYPGMQLVLTTASF